jgi:hypothetical protein
VDNSIRIGDLAAILTVGGIAIYVLGLIGLAVPIRRVFTRDLTTAWYAVALIPKTVVAGQGVRIWLRFPLVCTALFLLATAVAPTSAIAAYLLLTVIIGGAATLGAWKATELTRIERLLGGVGAFAGATVIYFGANGLTNNRLLSHLELPGLLSAFLRESHWLVSVLLLILGGFLLGLTPAIAAAPQLPAAKITKQDGGEEGPHPPKRYLVAHSDGYWHLFDENNDLLSIPDDQVSSVRIVRKEGMLLEEIPIRVWLLRILQRMVK